MAEYQVELYRLDGPTRVRVVALIDDDGHLVIYGRDTGEAPRQAFGEDEYEYLLTVPADQQDRLLLLLLQHGFAGPTAVSTFRAWLQEAGVEHEFQTA